MVYFLQIYCSHYGPKARPVAYGLLGEDYIIEREAEDPAEDWIAPLNRALESLPIQNTLYLFHGQFETRILWPYLTKKARQRLERAADLFDEIKKRTAIAPSPPTAWPIWPFKADLMDPCASARIFPASLKKRVQMISWSKSKPI